MSAVERLSPTPVVAVADQTGVTPAGPPAMHGDLVALDGVRGLAMLLVLWAHLTLVSLTYGATSMLPKPLVILGEFGDWGLHLFFVLSGFLLFLPYARSLLSGRNSPPSWRQFYTRRACRILPLYFVAIAIPLVTTLAFAVRGAGLHAVVAAGAMALLFHNMQTEAWQIISNWDTPLWSLAVEWQFYLVLPWAVLGFSWLLRPLRPGGRGRIATLLVLLSALAAFGLGMRALAYYTHFAHGYEDVTTIPHGVGFVFRLLFGLDGGKYIESFAIGMATSTLYVALVETGRLSAAMSTRLGCIATAVGALGLCGVAVWMHSSHTLPFPTTARLGGWPDLQDWPWAVFGVWTMGLCCCAIMFGAVTLPSWARRAWTTRPLRYVGKISYSGYVWHNIILWHLAPLGLAFGAWATPWLFVTTVVAVLVVSTLSYWLIERPFLPPSRRLSSSANARISPA